MDIPWPKSGDRLFKPGGYGALAAHTLLSFNDIGLVASGYKTAGDALVERLAEHGRNDSLVLPILFCYRQYVELRIKDIIEKTNIFEGSGENYKKIHDLKELWEILKSNSRHSVHENVQEAFHAVEDCIMQFHRVDEKGLVFRYPDVLSFRQLEDLGFHQIDLGNLKSVMDGIATFLDSTADVWEEGISNKY